MKGEIAMENKENELLRILKIALRVSYAVMMCGLNGCGPYDDDLRYDVYSSLNYSNYSTNIST